MNARRPIVTRLSDAAAVASTAADEFVVRLIELTSTQDVVHVMLTGGTVGIATLAETSRHPDLGKIDFSKVNFWWGDERFVASDSADRNSNQARTALLNRPELAEATLHEFPAADSLSLDQALSEFSKHFESVKPKFDLAFLGMGPDGHIASLFPGKTAPSAGVSLIAEADSPKPPPQRLSFSYEALNEVDEIWFVVAGADKAQAVDVAFSDQPERLPVGRVTGRKATKWFIDATAGNLVWGC